jgi:uncharacterized surface protein with fasciclin (FAS1) repeats
MTCRKTRPAAWLIATPLFPFLVAAWAGGAARRKGDSCATAEERLTTRDEAAEDRRKTRCSRPTKDIVDTALAAGSFDALVKALDAANLADTLKGEGPYTVFAPVDDAFDRLPEGALAALHEDTEKLAAVLTFHVVPGRVEAAALDSYAAVKTVQGKSLDVDTSIGVKVGSAYVVQADIEASNGVIHAIDSVLLPE